MVSFRRQEAQWHGGQVQPATKAGREGGVAMLHLPPLGCAPRCPLPTFLTSSASSTLKPVASLSSRARALSLNLRPSSGAAAAGAARHALCHALHTTLQAALMGTQALPTGATYSKAKREGPQELGPDPPNWPGVKAHAQHWQASPLAP